jgi:putative ABC transport system ATP-binding protein
MAKKDYIQIEELTMIYKMGETQVNALAGVSLGIAQGSFTVIMGPSGSGKSTLLYLLGGLDKSTSGKIVVNGENLSEMDENTLAEYRQTKVGFIFQSFNLIVSMTAEENVAFPLRFLGVASGERRTRSIELMERVGLKDRVGHRPTELSGGQQQRVSIARALVNDPPLILADEPTGNLDSTSGFAIMEVLSDLHRAGKTVIVVTHDQRMLQFATNRVYLLDGYIVDEKAFLAATQMLPKQA